MTIRTCRPCSRPCGVIADLGWILMPLWAIIIVFAVGCGSGTEVGNGFKPGQDSDDADSDKSSADPLPANGSGAESQDDDSANPPDLDPGSIDGNTALPKSLLFAGCGSVFAEQLELSFDLVAKDSDRLVWRVDSGASSVVTLRGDEAADAWDIDLADPEAMSVKNDNGELFVDPYTCRSEVDHAISVQDDGSFLDVATVIIDSEATHYTVTWSVTYTTDAGPRRLQSMRIEGDGGDAQVDLVARY